MRERATIATVGTRRGASVVEPRSPACDRDDNVFVCGRDREPGGVENVFWPPGTSPRRGTYTVEVVEYARCTTPAAWTVEVRINGQLVARRTGTHYGSFTFAY